MCMPTFVPCSGLFAELVKHGKLLQNSKPDTEEYDDDHEQGEIPAEVKKRKHSPIVWHPPEKHAKLSILERAQQEAMALRQRQEDLDFDPDAPPAMKASPSFSGSDGRLVCMQHS